MFGVRAHVFTRISLVSLLSFVSLIYITHNVSQENDFPNQDSRMHTQTHSFEHYEIVLHPECTSQRSNTGTFLMSLGITHWILRKSSTESVQNDRMFTSRSLLRILLRKIALLLAYQSSSTLWISVLSCFVVAFGIDVFHFIFDWINWCCGRGEYYFTRKPDRCHLSDGRFLTQDEYELRKQITTEKEMRKMCSSPAFQRWIRQNADRIQVLPRRRTHEHED